MNKKVKKVIQGTISLISKVGIFTYNQITDELSNQAQKLNRLEREQLRNNYAGMSEEELIKVGKENNGAKKESVRKELLERRSDEAFYNFSSLKEYGSYNDTYKIGEYITDDNSMTIRITRCSDVKMDFLISSKHLEKQLVCTGKFLGSNRVVYSGNHFTLLFEWNGDDEFRLSGMIPWEEEKVNMMFLLSGKLNGA